VDLAFILDSSGSVGSYNFQQVKNFVKDVVDFFNIGTSGTHVAVVTYSTYTRLEFNLKAHYTKSAMKNAVGNIYYRGGWTYTADALDFVRRNIFVTSQVSSLIVNSKEIALNSFFVVQLQNSNEIMSRSLGNLTA